MIMPNIEDLTLAHVTQDDGFPIPSENMVKVLQEFGVKDIMLGFSRGKDSIAMWLWLRQFDFNIHPYWLYWCPGLEFEEESLAYYEDWFGQKMIRAPHPLCWEAANAFVYQEPHNVAVIRAAGVVNFDFAHMEAALAIIQGLDIDTFTAVGFRSADNIDRRNLIKQKGALGFARRRWYHAIWDWKIDRVAEIINDSGIKLPIDYKYFGRTLGFWDHQYLQALKEHFPSDYKKMQEWAPMIDLEFLRYNLVDDNGKTNAEAGKSYV